MSGDEDFKTGFFAGIGVALFAGALLACLFFTATSDESDNTTQLEERINVLELYYYDVSGSLQLIRECVEKTEDTE